MTTTPDGAARCTGPARLGHSGAVAGESDNVRLARLAYEAWNRNDLAGVLMRCDPGIEWRMSELFARGGRVLHGHAGVKEVYETFRETFSILRIHPLEFIEEDGRIVVPVRMAGRPRGTEDEVVFELVQAWTHRDGLAVRLDVYESLEEARAQAAAASGAILDVTSAAGTGLENR